MNKKGFTLIELIVTIALLGIIAVVSFVSITKVIEENNKKECKNLETTIINATKSYVSDNRYSNITLTSVTAETLLKKGYLTTDLVNPYTKEVIESKNINIDIVLNSDYTPKTITVKKWYENYCKA